MQLDAVFASTPVPVPETALTGQVLAATYLKESYMVGYSAWRFNANLSVEIPFAHERIRHASPVRLAVMPLCMRGPT